MIGQKPPISTDERIARIEALVSQNNRALERASRIGRRFL
jgi:hypothetical protein